MNASSNSVAHGLLLGWVARFGVPTTITSDWGESNVWHRLMRLLGTHYICTMVYHPCTNGVVEWMHKQLKAVLMAHSPQSQWTKVLPLVLLGIHSALKEDIACTSAELVYRSTLSLPRFLYNLLHRHPGCNILHYKVNIHHSTTLGQFQVLKRNPKFFTWTSMVVTTQFPWIISNQLTWTTPAYSKWHSHVQHHPQCPATLQLT